MGLKNSSVILLLSMALLSCNNGSSNSGTANETKAEYKEGYNFIEINRCKTAPHEFKASSAEAVKKRLCEALQDPELNNNCAEDQRKIYFDQKCSGYTWTPSKKEPKDPIVVVPPANNLELESRSLLRAILVSDAEVSVALDAESLKKAQVLAQDLIQCGLSFVRPRCLDYDFTNTSFPVRFYTENGLNFFVSEMVLPDW